MTRPLIINAKSVAAIGMSAGFIILALKVKPEQAAEVLNKMFSASQFLFSESINMCYTVFIPDPGTRPAGICDP